MECVKNPDSFFDLAKNLYDVSLNSNTEKILLKKYDLFKAKNPKKELKN